MQSQPHVHNYECAGKRARGQEVGAMNKGIVSGQVGEWVNAKEVALAVSGQMNQMDL